MAHGGRDSPENVRNSSNYFSANAISLRTQKKLAGRMPLSFARFFIDDTSSRLFENVNRVLCLYIKNKKEADKIMKNVVKLNVKLAILNLNNVLNEEESLLASDVKDAFHNLAECFLRIRQPSRNRMPGPPGTVDRMLQLVEQSSELVMRITQRHLSEKNRRKIKASFDFFGQRDFMLVASGSEDEQYKELLVFVTEDLEELVDRGLI